MIITILVAVIAIVEISRLVLTHKRGTKKAHFKQKLEGTLKMIWDLEFKKFKTKEIREDIRQEYDSLKSRVETMRQQIEAWPKGQNVDERKRIEDQKVLAERDISRFESQMKGLDVQISGEKATNESPEGIIGITEQMDSLRELAEMLRDHIKQI